MNIIIWSRLAEEQHRELLGSRLMGIEDQLEREGRVTHLIAQRLRDHSHLLGRLLTSSRDFH